MSASDYDSSRTQYPTVAKKVTMARTLARRQNPSPEGGSASASPGSRRP
jgi:hypothetical protein